MTEIKVRRITEIEKTKAIEELHMITLGLLLANNWDVERALPSLVMAIDTNWCLITVLRIVAPPIPDAVAACGLLMVDNLARAYAKNLMASFQHEEAGHE